MAAPMTMGWIPDGHAGTDATLRKMRELIRAGKVNPAVRQKAAAIAAAVRPQKYYAEILRRIHAFVRDEIAYIPDIRDVETLHAPEFILSHKYGDCDDKSVLVASMFESIGFKTKLVAVGNTPAACSHVYVEVKLGRHWIPVETTENVPLGWAPTGVFCRRTLEV